MSQSDIDYTSNYYREQEPTFLNLCAIMHGVQPVTIDKSFTYCELGCGTGHTSLIMAANYPQGKFIAVDFNPTHISQAKKRAEEAGLDNIEFLELSFEDIVKDSSLLPKCNFITFHGTYAWVNDTNRQNISDICKKHLSPAGLVYNSYNAQPGWAALAPLQKTLNLLSQQYRGNSTQRYHSAINFINQFKKLKPAYFEFNSTMLTPRLDSIEKADPHFIHEYLNEDWEALYFTDVSKKMAEAKLNYVGLANPAEAYSYIIIPEEFKKQLAHIEDFSTREMMKDLAYNTSFRKDLYSRGGRTLDAKQQEKYLNKLKWVLISNENQTSFKFNLSVGEASGNLKTYLKVIKTLSKKILSTKELATETGIPVRDLVQTLIFLYSSNKIALENKSKKISSFMKLNKVLASEGIHNQQMLAIAANEIGTAVSLNSIELAFLNAHLDKNTDSSDVIDTIYKDLSSKGLQLTVKDKTYEGVKMKNFLKAMEKVWLKETLPRLKTLGSV